MPGKAKAGNFSGPHQGFANVLEAHEALGAGLSFYPMSPAERRLLLTLQREAIQYFIDNQLPHGLVLDRQSNHGPRAVGGLCSTSATGLGLMAVALAATPEYQMLSPGEAKARVRTALDTALDRLPSDHGMMPHFLDAQTLEPVGGDRISTIDSSWLVAGALWASAILESREAQALAWRLYRRMNWHYWSTGLDGAGKTLLRHGKGPDGHFLPHAWDRLNAETAFMYILGAGAESTQSLPPAAWADLDPCYGSVAGLRFSSADLGLFVFQYSLELLDFQEYQIPGPLDLYAEACIATQANYEACRSAVQFQTYRQFWGLSAGDGPGQGPSGDTYRCYSPLAEVDGTAHITATLASLSTRPELAWQNILTAEHHREWTIHGRYGYSNVNLDRNWVSRDVIGIDLGVAVLALENYLHAGRVRRVFQQLECVQQGLERLGGRHRTPIPDDAEWRQAS